MAETIQLSLDCMKFWILVSENEFSEIHWGFEADPSFREVWRTDPFLIVSYRKRLGSTFHAFLEVA